MSASIEAGETRVSRAALTILVPYCAKLMCFFPRDCACRHDTWRMRDIKKVLVDCPGLKERAFHSQYSSLALELSCGFFLRVLVAALVVETSRCPW